MNNRLLTPAEAADALRTTIGTLRKWKCIGRFPALTNTVEKGGAVVKRGRAVFYREDRVQAFNASSQTA